MNVPRDEEGLAQIAQHYARSDLLAAIQSGLLKSGKTTHKVAAEDLAPVDEFHIGGRAATAEVMERLNLTPSSSVIDIGCGLGGPARFAAAHYGCRVTGIDLTRDYVEAGNVLCDWLGLSERVTLHHASALEMPFPDGAFDAAYMLHVGMNIADKGSLFAEAARVLRSGSLFAIYDVMQTSQGELNYPVPWSTTRHTSALAPPQQYRNALHSAGFDILSERDRRDFALAYFSQQRSLIASADGPPPLGLHILMGDRRKDQVRNMSEGISNGLIAPMEMIARKQ